MTNSLPFGGVTECDLLFYMLLQILKKINPEIYTFGLKEKNP